MSSIGGCAGPEAVNRCRVHAGDGVVTRITLGFVLVRPGGCRCQCEGVCAVGPGNAASAPLAAEMLACGREREYLVVFTVASFVAAVCTSVHGRLSNEIQIE